MKFKTKEELIEEVVPDDNPMDDYQFGYLDAIEESFKSFAERVEFYKKYEGKPLFFGNEHINEWELFNDDWYRCYRTIQIIPRKDWLKKLLELSNYKGWKKYKRLMMSAVQHRIEELKEDERV